MPTTHQQRKRRMFTNAASKKKSHNSQRGYTSTRNQPNVLRLALREGPSLWIAPELDGGRNGRDGLWVAELLAS